MLRPALAVVALLGLLGACLFGGAGTLRWPMAWAFLGVFAASSAAAFLLLSPDLLRERARPGPGVDPWDPVIAGLGFLALYPGVAFVAGLDALRFGWSPQVPLAVQLAALGVFAAGYAFALWAMRVNRFFASFVRIQRERGHRVVSEGPYAWVRHPGYAGALLAHLALPLALGSCWAFAPALVGALLFGIRTDREDRILARDLPGYRDYQRRVPWRLLPHAW